MANSTCTVEGCASPSRTKGLCHMHYARVRRHGEAGGPKKQHAVSWAGKICSMEGCDNPVRSIGYCLAHYKRYKRWGDPNIKRPTKPAAERFAEKVNRNGPIPANRPGLGPCWEWTAGKMASGYGIFASTGGPTGPAHRWAYAHYIGPIENDNVIDHLCRNRSCVNPSHLEQVTNEENLRRGAGYGLRNGMRSRCVNGHEYTPENTYTNPRTQKIYCRECSRERDRQPHRNATRRRKNSKKEEPTNV